MAPHSSAALALSQPVTRAAEPVRLLPRPGSNWVHPSLEEREVPGCGFGAYASQNIPAGTLLVVYGGRVISLQEFESLSTEMQNYPYQV